MIRIYIAALLLKSTGSHVEYRVQRRKRDTGKDGTTVLRTQKYREAKAKYRAMRIADTDTITVRLVATTNQRHGTIEGETK